MAQPTVLQVTLSEQSIEFVRTKIASGEYSSESDVLNESLAVLQDQSLTLDQWIHQIALPSYDRFLEDSSTGQSIDEVRALLSSQLQSMTNRD